MTLHIRNSGIYWGRFTSNYTTMKTLQKYIVIAGILLVIGALVPATADAQVRHAQASYFSNNSYDPYFNYGYNYGYNNNYDPYYNDPYYNQNNNYPTGQHVSYNLTPHAFGGSNYHGGYNSGYYSGGGFCYVDDDPDDPRNPRNLRAFPTYGGVELSWDYNGNPCDLTSFWIMRSPTGDGTDWVRVGSVSPTQLYFFDSSAREGRTYFYRVRANGNGEHKWSERIRVNTGRIDDGYYNGHNGYNGGYNGPCYRHGGCY
jgi:hypothetical protein